MTDTSKLRKVKFRPDFLATVDFHVHIDTVGMSYREGKSINWPVQTETPHGHACPFWP